MVTFGNFVDFTRESEEARDQGRSVETKRYSIVDELDCQDIEKKTSPEMSFAGEAFWHCVRRDW